MTIVSLSTNENMTIVSMSTNKTVASFPVHDRPYCSHWAIYSLRAQKNTVILIVYKRNRQFSHCPQNKHSHSHCQGTETSFLTVHEITWPSAHCPLKNITILTAHERTRPSSHCPRNNITILNAHERTWPSSHYSRKNVAICSLPAKERGHSYCSRKKMTILALPTKERNQLLNVHERTWSFLNVLERTRPSPHCTRNNTTILNAHERTRPSSHCPHSEHDHQLTVYERT